MGNGRRGLRPHIPFGVAGKARLAGAGVLRTEQVRAAPTPHCSLIFVSIH